MAWEITSTAVFEAWFHGLTNPEKVDVITRMELLRQEGVALGDPYTSKIQGNPRPRNSHMRELKIQHAGRPYRILYAFDPWRAAVLLLGGDKTGDDRWYLRNVPLADDLYDAHVDARRKERKAE